jgi:hypothetical protein
LKRAGYNSAMDVERTMEFILEQQARIAAYQMKAEEHFARHDQEIVQIRNIMRRAVRLAVQEARAERKRRQELDARFDRKMDQLASAHLLTEEKLDKLGIKVDRFVIKVDRLVDGLLGGGRNGDPV